MDEKEMLGAIEKAAMPLQRLNGPLKVLALLQLAGEFYTKTQRKDLYAIYEKLCAEDTRLFDNLQTAHADVIDAGIGYEKRVEKYGDDEAKKQMAPIMEAMDARRESIAAISAFRTEHEIIFKLISAKEDVRNL